MVIYWPNHDPAWLELEDLEPVWRILANYGQLGGQKCCRVNRQNWSRGGKEKSGLLNGRRMPIVLPKFSLIKELIINLLF